VGLYVVYIRERLTHVHLYVVYIRDRHTHVQGPPIKTKAEGPPRDDGGLTISGNLRVRY
jgi:hypothetical protein